MKHKAARQQTRLSLGIILTAIAAGVFVTGWSIFVIQDRPPVQDSAVLLERAVPILPKLKTNPVGQKPLYESYPELGQKVGTITLESLDLSWPIYEGTEEKELSRGVGHYVGSVFPGMEDNSILSGHRSTVFGRLGELKIGELVHIKTEAGIFSYQIRSFRVVDRSDQTVIMPSDTAVLTLTTCYPFNSWGPSSEAYIVTADLVASVIS